jgi:hypothetical protein
MSYVSTFINSPIIGYICSITTQWISNDNENGMFWFCGYVSVPITHKIRRLTYDQIGIILNNTIHIDPAYELSYKDVTPTNITVGFNTNHPYYHEHPAEFSNVADMVRLMAAGLRIIDVTLSDTDISTLQLENNDTI